MLLYSLSQRAESPETAYVALRYARDSQHFLPLCLAPLQLDSALIKFGSKKCDEVRIKPRYESSFIEWGKVWGMLWKIKYLLYYQCTRIPGGQPKHLNPELPRTSLNILAREDVVVLQ